MTENGIRVILRKDYVRKVYAEELKVYFIDSEGNRHRLEPRIAATLFGTYPRNIGGGRQLALENGTYISARIVEPLKQVDLKEVKT